MLKGLKKYDKYLCCKKTLDGCLTINRQSPFSSQKQYKVFDIKNKYIGSCSWVFKKIMLMDSQHFDIAGRVLENNRRIKNQKDDSRISEEVSDIFVSGGDKIII